MRGWSRADSGRLRGRAWPRWVLCLGVAGCASSFAPADPGDAGTTRGDGGLPTGPDAGPPGDAGAGARDAGPTLGERFARAYTRAVVADCECNHTAYGYDSPDACVADSRPDEACLARRIDEVEDEAQRGSVACFAEAYDALADCAAEGCDAPCLDDFGDALLGCLGPRPGDVRALEEALSVCL